MRMGEVFMNGIDDSNKEDFEVYPLELNCTQPFTTRVAVTTKTFSDGSPVLKYLMVEHPQYVNYTFNPGTKMDLIHMIYDNKVFWYDNGNWYMLDQSLDWLIEEFSCLD